MNVYRIDWEAMVDRALLAELAAAAGLDAAPAVAVARPALARILAACGGWPYATAKPGAHAQREFALRLLGEAFGQALGPAPQQVPGIALARARGGMRAIATVARVEVNLADVAALQSVAGMSQRRAEAIVAERLRGGPYSGITELAGRVGHVGQALMRKWAPFIGFMQPSAPRTGASGTWRRTCRHWWRRNLQASPRHVSCACSSASRCMLPRACIRTPTTNCPGHLESLHHRML